MASGIHVVRPEAYKKYTHFITKGFVDQNPNMQWCPAPGCTNAVLCELSTGTHRASYTHFRTPIHTMPFVVTELRVPCNCGYRFCFVCHGEAHAPAKCDDVRPNPVSHRTILTPLARVR
jgi:ariadne-1